AVALEQLLHLLFGLGQGGLAVTGQADALLEGAQRALQRQLAAPQALDQGLQLGEGGVEVDGFLAGHGRVAETWSGAGQKRSTSPLLRVGATSGMLGCSSALGLAAGRGAATGLGASAIGWLRSGSMASARRWASWRSRRLWAWTWSAVVPLWASSRRN